jgi:hypothetical protein
MKCTVQAKNIKASIDWVKDQDRANKTPSIADLEEESFLKAIRESAKREIIREAAKENAESLAKAASPAKLTGEKVWNTWKARLENQLSMLYGVNGVPLVYVIRKTKNQKKGRSMPTSLKNISRNVNSPGRNSLRILNMFTTLSSR